MALAVNNNVLGCMVNGNLDLLSRPVAEGETRPCDCDDPTVAERSPMGKCAYRVGNLSRCGCPALDRKKNPELWATYVGLVRKTLEKRTYQKEITITFFASGALLLDAELLEEVFRSSQKLQEWKGKLHLQFVDLKYKPVYREVEERSQEDFNKQCGGAAALVLALFAFLGATKIENRRGRRTLQVLGGCSAAAGIGLLASTARERTHKPIEKAMRQFSKEVAAKLPIDSVSYFGSTQECISEGRKPHCIFGYDIENGVSALEDLRARSLESGGKLYGICKTNRGPMLLKGSFIRPVSMRPVPQTPERVRLRA